MKNFTKIMKNLNKTVKSLESLAKESLKKRKAKQIEIEKIKESIKNISNEESAALEVAENLKSLFSPSLKD